MGFSGLGQFLSGKAKESRVQPSDLFSQFEVIDVLYHRVVDNDYITPDQRLVLIERVNKLSEFDFEELSSRDFEAIEQVEIEPKEHTFLNFVRLLSKPESTLAVASLFGALSTVVGISYLSSGSTWDGPGLLQSIFDPRLLTAVVASIAAAVSMALFISLRERAGKSHPRDEGMSAVLSFERDFEDELKKRNLEYQRGQPHEPFDFIVRTSKQQILIEAQYSLYRIPQHVMLKTVARLKNYANLQAIPNIFIVSRDEIPSAYLNLNEENFQLVTINEFFKMISAGR